METFQTSLKPNTQLFGISVEPTHNASTNSHEANTQTHPNRDYFLCHHLVFFFLFSDQSANYPPDQLTELLSVFGFDPEHSGFSVYQVWCVVIVYAAARLYLSVCVFVCVFVYNSLSSHLDYNMQRFCRMKPDCSTTQMENAELSVLHDINQHAQQCPVSGYVFLFLETSTHQIST